MKNLWVALYVNSTDFLLKLAKYRQPMWFRLYGARIVCIETPKIRSATAHFKQRVAYFRWMMMIFAVMVKGEKKMARYIDADNINLKGIAVFDQDLEVLIPLSNVRRALQMTPTADVLPDYIDISVRYDDTLAKIRIEWK